MANFTWVLSEIRTRFRELTGRSSTSDISNDDVDALINDYYQNYFPEDALVTNFDEFFTEALAATDSGEYTIDQTVVKLMEPMSIGTNQLTFYQDRDYFFSDYPLDEQYITSPTLAIGSSDSAKVKNSAFSYDISGYSYSKAAAETSFSGLNTVPQNKYGAFSLKIDSDGTITIAESDDNETGYDTPSLAIAGLAAADSDSAYMGYVTVISTDAGGFVPGTTALDDSAVTDTYTNGDPGKRGCPVAALYTGQTLYLSPKPDDIYQFRAMSELNRPAALTSDTAPPYIRWGPAIALGAAILYLAPRGGQERIMELTGVANFSMATYLSDSIKTKKRFAMRGRSASPSF